MMFRRIIRDMPRLRPRPPSRKHSTHHLRHFRLGRHPANHVAHAAPPAAFRLPAFSAELSTSYSSTTVPPPTGLRPTGNEPLPGFFFTSGNSATLAWHLAQYTPAPPSRTHNPPQCSQYFNSTRTSPAPLSVRLLLIIPPKE